MIMGLAFLGGMLVFWVVEKWRLRSFHMLAQEILSHAEVEAEKRINRAELEGDKRLHEKERQFERRVEQERKRVEEWKKEVNAFEGDRKALDQARIELEKHQEQLKREQNNHRKRVEKLAKMTPEEAEELLVEKVHKEIADQVQQAIEEGKKQVEQEAKKLLIETLGRLAAPTAAEATVTKVPIEQEEIKKRIVGREGRNIRCFENLTGVSLLVDETPGAIVISTFDPIRQEIARKSLQSLIFEGRIHPSRIEEVVMEQKDKMDQTIRREGEEACIKLGINDLHPELIYRIGKLKFHQSLGQNLLTHSSEVATLMELLAAELNLDTTLAKRIGLLHDIGKTEKSPLPHATVGAKLAEKWGESAAVCNGIASHHDNTLPQTVEGALLPIADTLSASRPGARKQAFADYITRLEKLESLVESFPGVQKAYALQSGKEVRVFVDPDAVDDTNALLLSRSLSQAIEKEFRFYGKIKLHLIREKQIISYAI